MDDQLIVGGIKEKEEALNAYDDAISSGGRGFLLTQDDKIAGAFSLNVGNLPPGKVCSKKRSSICMSLHLLPSVRPSVHRSASSHSYVSELTIEGEFVRMNLPITHLPIFGNATTTSSTNHNLKCAAKHLTSLNDVMAMFKCGSHTPNHIFFLFVSLIKDGLHMIISTDMPAPVHAVECPSGHQLTSTITGNTARLQVRAT